MNDVQRQVSMIFLIPTFSRFFSAVELETLIDNLDIDNYIE